VVGVVELGIEGTCLKECFFEVDSVRKCCCRECGDASLRRDKGDVFISAIMHGSWIVLVDTDIAAVSGDRNEYVVVCMLNGRYASQVKSGLKCRAVQFESGGDTRPEYAVNNGPFYGNTVPGHVSCPARVSGVDPRRTANTSICLARHTSYMHSDYTQGILRVYSEYTQGLIKLIVVCCCILGPPS